MSYCIIRRFYHFYRQRNEKGRWIENLVLSFLSEKMEEILILHWVRKFQV